MAVLGRLLVASGERLDLADVLSIDSYTAGDFKYLLQGLIGASNPLILKGFEVIDPGTAIGTQNLSIGIADSVVFYPTSLAGPFYVGLPEGDVNAQPLVPELVQNATNFVYLTFSTFDTSQDSRAFWDPDLNGGAGGEFSQDINTESVLSVQVGVSTSSFPDNTIPVCKVVMGPTVIQSIQDCRELMFRLGSGGISPNPFNRFNWPDMPSATYERQEPPTTISSGAQPDPFEGADKNIQNLKQWMDAVMSKLAELGGSTYWYEDVSATNIINNFTDALGLAIVSKGKFEHSSGTAGQLTWTEDIKVEYVATNKDVIIRSGSKTLADGEVAYVPVVRNASFNGSNIQVNWFNGTNFVNGPVTSFQNLVQGDWIKAQGDPDAYLVRAEQFYAGTNLSGGVTTPALAQSVRLSANYQGVTQTQFGVRSQGVYTSAQVLVAQRGDPALEVLGGNFEWIGVRSDTIMSVGSIVTTTLTGVISDQDGSTAKFTAGAAHGLVNGDRVTIPVASAYTGTYQVEVESSTVFSFPTAVTTPEVSTQAFYATVTTIARSTPYGLQLENADHGFETDQTIIFAGTVGYNGSRLINVRSATTFTVPVATATASSSTGTVTLARIEIREDFAGASLAQGESIGIGHDAETNILSYIGMGSLSETHPTYNEPIGYNTLWGMSNYNGTTIDNLTLRAAQLTAMMADKAQDKTIKLLSQGYQSVNNTTLGGNQVISFNANANPPPQLNVVLPGSSFNSGTVGLTGSLTLATNQAAYITIDRNTVFTVANLSAVTVANITAVPVDENVLVLAIRLGSTDVWLWDGFYAAAGSITPVPGFLDTIVDQDRNLKLVRGGTWSWGAVPSSGPDNIAWYHFGGASSIEFTSGSTTWYGQSFTTITAGDITSIDTYAFNGGGATGSYVVAIYADNGSGLPTGSPLGTSATVSINTLTAVLDTPTTATFSTPIAVTAATKYHFVLQSNVTAGNIFFSGYTGNPYTGGTVVKTTNSGGSWTTIPTEDFPFFVNGTAVVGAVGIQYSAIADDSTQLTDFSSSANRVALKYVAASDFNLSSIIFRMQNTGATGFVVVDTYIDNGSGVPGPVGSPAATLVDTSAAIDISTIPSSKTNITFTMSRAFPLPITTGYTYHFVVRPTSITSGTNLTVWGYSTSALPENNAEYSSNGGTSWTSSPAHDVYTIINGSINGALTSNSLTWSANANIQIPDVAESANLIPAGSINLNADGDVAYVEVNRSGVGGSLTVSTSAIASLAIDDNTVIIARRTGTNVIVGTHSFLLVPGESKTLDSGMSDQNLALIGSSVTEATSNPNYAARGSVNRIESNSEGALDAIARHDVEFDKYFGLFRMIAKTAGTQTRVRITGSDRVVFTGETLTQSMSALRVSFTGAEIDFATGSIFGGDASLPLSTNFSTPLGVNFTPTTITANQYLWYSIAAIPSGTNADNTVNVQFNVLAGASSAATPLLAAKPALAGLTPLGYVAVRDNGSGGSGTILNVLQANIAQLGVGASSNAAGLQTVRLYDPLSTTLPTGNPVTIDGVSVNTGDLVLFSNLGSGNNEVYKAVGTGTNITSWQAQFVFNGAVTPTSGNTVVVTAGGGFADTIGIFTGSTWSFNSKVRYFNGADYWEVSSLNSASLADNQVSPATIASFAWLHSENMIIDYSITRGTAKETGSVYITTDGIVVGLSTANVNNNISAGITFLGAISGANFNLNYTSTNAGTSGQIKFVLRRWSDAAGGPGGIPSYSGGGGGAVTGSGATSEIAIWNTGTTLTGNTNFNYDTSNNLFKLGSGANIQETTILQSVSTLSGVQTNAALFSYSTAYTFALVDYSVIVGSNYRIGTLLITQDGVSTVNVVDTFSDIGSTGLSFASPGVTHTISAGNVNIKYNSTGVGAGTFKYTMRRWG